MPALRTSYLLISVISCVFSQVRISEQLLIFVIDYAQYVPPEGDFFKFLFLA